MWPKLPDLIESIVAGSRSTATARGTYFLLEASLKKTSSLSVSTLVALGPKCPSASRPCSWIIVFQKAVETWFLNENC